MTQIEYREYWSQVQGIARDCWDEAGEEWPDEGDLARREDAAHDLTWQYVDGHQWIIYYAYNNHVLHHSNNDNAYFVEYGALEADSASDALMRMAFAALLADVREALYDLIKEDGE